MRKDCFIKNNQLILAIMILALSFVFVMAGSSKIYAGETEKKTDTSTLTNRGFMKNPPQELKEKFPMCDAFLDVEWIDKEKKIGYSTYDLYKDGKKDGQMTALIYLNQYYPHFDYDLNVYKRKGKLNEIFSFIKKGEIVGKDFLLTISDSKKKIMFWPTIGWIGIKGPSFSDHCKNVCIPYPGYEMIWIIEGKHVGKVFTEKQIKERYEIMKKHFPDLQLSMFKEWAVIDLNRDDIDDYYGEYGWFVYSFANQYFEMTKTGAGVDYIEFNIPRSSKTCVLKPFGVYYLTTDGKNYFFSNQCNLTELTR